MPRAWPGPAPLPRLPDPPPSWRQFPLGDSLGLNDDHLFVWDRGMHCWAAIMMFLLLGSTNTVSAGVALITWSRSSVEGFIVCPPDTIPSTPRSRNTASRPCSGANRHKAVTLLVGGHLRLSGPVLTLQFRLIFAQIVGALGLSVRRQGLLLGAHILDLGQLQRAVLLGLGQGVPGNVGMDMDLEGLVVLSDDQAVPNSVQEGPAGSDPHLPSACARYRPCRRQRRYPGRQNPQNPPFPERQAVPCPPSPGNSSPIRQESIPPG